MTRELTDKTGEPVTIGIAHVDPVNAYTVRVADAQPVGRAEFIDSPVTVDERIFFHTEVDPEFGGRGLAGLLVREALADSIRNGLTIVPVCPLFARHLTRHGDEFVAAGGAYRTPTRADLALVMRVTGGPA